MTLMQQVWGTTNEKIHTIGTVFLAASACCFLLLGMEVKTNGILTFSCFAVGVNLIGVSTLRNAWGRWRTGEDSLILLKKREQTGRVHFVAIHIGQWRLQWQGRVAHVDVGKFEVRRIVGGDSPSSGSGAARSYQIFRAYYWRVCSSLLFQASFGLCALGYGVWLLSFLMTYQGSTV